MGRFQKDLSDSINPESGLNDYDENFLPTPANGPLASDSIFDSVYNFGFFTPELVNKAREEFKEFLEMSEVDIPKSELDLLELISKTTS